MTSENQYSEFNDEECILEGTGTCGTDIFSTSSPSVDESLSHYLNCISIFRNIVSDVEIDQQLNNSIIITIPSKLLPTTLQVAYGFIDSLTLLECSLFLDNYNWRVQPCVSEIKNPISHNYCGKCLVENAKENFFTNRYKPKKFYRSAPLLLASSNKSDPTVVEQLESNGYSHNQSVRAASLFENNFERSIAFLQTGQCQLEKPFEILASYDDCPLLFFVLEILDSILDLQDHCAMCGEPTCLGLKPGVCDKEFCLYRFISIGVGVPLSIEIKRDPYAADFLFSVFCCSYQTRFFNPKPEFADIEKIDDVVKHMKRMEEIAKYKDDNELCRNIGSDSCNILRWIIFTCRSNFLRIPKSLEFQQFRENNKNCIQFMALTASPEQESIFQQMKKVYGSRFLWHGSPVERWHSIIRQGLKNMTGTQYMEVGDAYGAGIYFAPDSRTSLDYARPSQNLFKASKLGKNIHIIALCEVINFPINTDIDFDADVIVDGVHTYRKLKGRLNDFGWCLTLTMNEASIVRFVFVNLQDYVNVVDKKLENIPTLNQVLKCMANI